MKVQRRQDQVVDWLSRDGETIVLARRSIVRLSDVGAAVFALTERPVDIEDLARGLEAEFGPPGSGSALAATTDAVTELVRHGVVRRSE
ncbi:hypothetical protein [Knoellia aerolata]|uniref:PqqD family protein n=1 Tax=Knoellia aerolata DSM 18566 TaxID=1385519 RepID=A0A0A0JXE1_9MICO|nr:hypothetical protein [Knoellia aerolata]KGN41379.1 hypothetical protein N801_07465 [Knoellia aerolata DSM 18566]